MGMGKMTKHKKRGKKQRNKSRLVRVNPQNRLNATILPTTYKNNSLLKDKMKVTFRYASRIIINPAAAGNGVHVFSANGMYDPDLTGVGHQPRGFDEVMPLYDHYTVIGSKCTVAACNLSTGGGILGIALKDSTTTKTANDYLEDYTSNSIFGVSGVNDSNTFNMYHMS